MIEIYSQKKRMGWQKSCRRTITRHGEIGGSRSGLRAVAGKLCLVIAKEKKQREVGTVSHPCRKKRAWIIKPVIPRRSLSRGSSMEPEKMGYDYDAASRQGHPELATNHAFRHADSRTSLPGFFDGAYRHNG